MPTKALRETALNISGFLNRDIDGVNLRYKDTLDVQTFLYRQRRISGRRAGAVAANLEKHHVPPIFWFRFVRRSAYPEDRLPFPGKPTISGAVILIATGSRPVRPPSFPFDHPNVYDSSTHPENTETAQKPDPRGRKNSGLWISLFVWRAGHRG